MKRSAWVVSAAEITLRVTTIAPSLLAIVGCGALTAAKIIDPHDHTTPSTPPGCGPSQIVGDNGPQ